MLTKGKKWVKSSPWGNYLEDNITKEADKRREIGKNGKRNNKNKSIAEEVKKILMSITMYFNPSLSRKSRAKSTSSLDVPNLG